MNEITDDSWRWNEPQHVREFLVDDLEDPAQIRLKLAGDERTLTAVEASVDVDESWRLTQRFCRKKGTWVADGEPAIVHRADPSRQPTARMRRKTVDRHVPRINALLREALQIDERLHEDPKWRETIAERWRMTEIRSRRGGKTELDPDEIHAHTADGTTLPRVAVDLGHFNPQSLSNRLHLTKRRRLTDDQDPK